MFRDVFTWWIGQLLDPLPARWVRFGSVGEDALVVEPVGPLSSKIDSIRINLRRHGKETALGQFRVTADSLVELPRPPGNRFVLRLRRADVLAKTVTLPIAAENQIHQTLSFQMDQETPFAHHEIYWSHFISERDRQNGRLSVRLLLVPRQSLAALLGALDHVGIVPNRAEIGEGPTKTASFHSTMTAGRSTAAARLIGSLSAGEGMRNVAFAAPAARLESVRAELFTITAEVAP